MTESFRSMFVTKFLKSLDEDIQHVKPMELGVLFERYQKLYQVTPKDLHPRVFEQLSLGLLLWMASSGGPEEEDVRFVELMALCKRDLAALVTRYSELRSKPEQ